MPCNRKVLFAGVLLLMMLLVGPAVAQPFDIIIPDASIGDSLTSELRRNNDLERDLSLEKLKNPASKKEAYLELGELRLEQGKLEEAQRFFEMVLHLQPENFRANQGLARVHYRNGDFTQTKRIYDDLLTLYPFSDVLKKEVDDIRTNLKSTVEVGSRIHEDNRGIQDISSTLDAFFPSFTIRKLSARYRFENWSLKDRGNKTSSQTLSSTFNYNLNHRNKLSLMFAPENIKGDINRNNWSFQGLTGTSNLHLAAYTGRNTFKENFQTTQLGMTENYLTLVLYGEIHDRTRISQSLTSGDISDSNSRRVMDTNILYFITRAGIPFLSLQLQHTQSFYEKQYTSLNVANPYWSPSDHRTTSFHVSWERGVGARWWWGLETQYISSTFRDLDPKTHWEQGIGYLTHVNYRFDQGRVFAEFSDTIKDYYRARMLAVYGSIDF